MVCIYGPGPRISYSSYASLTVGSKITNNISIITSYIFTTVFIATSGLHKRKMYASNHIKDDVIFNQSNGHLVVQNKGYISDRY